MCATCGCGADHTHHDHDHPHDHDHDHDHHHDHEPRTVSLEVDLLAKNDRLAKVNRATFADRGIVALNLMSSPGAGKTTLVERTIRVLMGELPVAVIEGDQATDRDAERIRATGCRAVQINTGAGCHLEADMIARAVDELDPPAGALLLVENIGNLVCPALFDLGEEARVVVMSVTEGDDKPIKYPHMFRAAEIMVLNKLDLLPYVDFDVEACIAHAHRVNPSLRVFQLSATTGEGLDSWCDWIRTTHAEANRAS